MSTAEPLSPVEQPEEQTERQYQRKAKKGKPSEEASRKTSADERDISIEQSKTLTEFILLSL
jgi:hypothetical protein